MLAWDNENCHFVPVHSSFLLIFYATTSLCYLASPSRFKE